MNYFFRVRNGGICQTLILLCGLCSVTSIVAGEPESKVIYDAWDIAYLQGNRSGYSHTSVVARAENGNTVYQARTELRLKVKRLSDVVTLAMDTGDYETKEGKVVGTFTRQFLGTKKTLDITGKVVGQQLILTLNKSKQLEPAPWDDNVVSLYKQQTIFQEKNVKPGDRFTYRSFEPSINLIVENVVRVKGYEKPELFGKPSKTKLLRVEITPKKVMQLQLPTMVVWLDQDRKPLRSQTEVPSLGTLVLYRGSKQLALRPGAVAKATDVILNQVIKLKRPIANPYKVRSAVYRIDTKGLDEPTSAFMKGPIQQIKNPKGNTFELHVDAAAPT